MNNSPLLIQESPLVVLPSLAKLLGLNEAIILQQIQYWLMKCGKEFEGYFWIYNSYDQWKEQFPFWCKNTIINAIKKLETSKILISGNFHDDPFRKSKWYRIDYAALNSLWSVDLPNIGTSIYQENKSPFEPVDNFLDETHEPLNSLTPLDLPNIGTSTNPDLPNSGRSNQPQIGRSDSQDLVDVYKDTEITYRDYIHTIGEKNKFNKNLGKQPKREKWNEGLKATAGSGREGLKATANTEAESTGSVEWVFDDSINGNRKIRIIGAYKGIDSDGREWTYQYGKWWKMMSNASAPTVRPMTVKNSHVKPMTVNNGYVDREEALKVLGNLRKELTGGKNDIA